MITTGQKLPEATLKGVGKGAIEDVHTRAFFAHKKVVMFGLPGAFTPLCSSSHVPGFIKQAQTFQEKGVDALVCAAVNDPFVLEAWKKELGVGEDIFFLSDGNGTWLKEMGLTFDGSGFFLGERSQRFAMVVEDGIVTVLEVEKNPGICERTGGDFFHSLL
jgi:peroxiredoxin